MVGGKKKYARGRFLARNALYTGSYVTAPDVGTMANRGTRSGSTRDPSPPFDFKPF